jgi:shikimate kinase
VETDDMIVSRDGRSIPEIFRQDGEEAFRRLETEAVQAHGLKSDDVIATGGGLPCRPGRMEALRALGTVVWLRGDLEELLARARRSGQRPMLDGRSPAEIDALYRAREPFYARAHLTVETAGLTIDQVVQRIVAALRETHARV